MAAPTTTAATNPIKTIEAMLVQLLQTVPLPAERDQNSFAKIVAGLVKANRGDTAVELAVELFENGLPNEYALVALHTGLSESLATLCTRVTYKDGKVVATAPIRQGDLITLYPWHAVIVGNVWLLDFQCSEPPTGNACRFRVADRSTEITHLVSDAMQTDKPQWLGHVIRDGVGNPYADILNREDRDAIAVATLAYTDKVNEVCNATFVQMQTKTVAVVAVRDIAAGEEITINRDAPYWYTVQFGVNEMGLSILLDRVLTRDQKRSLANATMRSIAKLEGAKSSAAPPSSTATDGDS